MKSVDRPARFYPANSSSGVRFCDSGIPEAGTSGCNRRTTVLVNCCFCGGYEFGWVGRVIAPLFSRAKFELNSSPCSRVLLGRRLCGAAKTRPAVGRFPCRKMLTKGAFSGLSSKQRTTEPRKRMPVRRCNAQQRFLLFPQTIVRESSSACGSPEWKKLFITTKAWIVSSNPGRTVARF